MKPYKSNKYSSDITVNLQKLMDRLPPSAPEAEMSLLGSMILAGAGDIHVIGDVTSILQGGASSFEKPAHQALYQILIDLYNKNASLDSVQIIQELRTRNLLEQVGGTDYVVQLAESVPIAENAPHYARIVSDSSRRRNIIGAAGRILHSAYESGVPVDDLADMCEVELYANAKPCTASGEPKVLIELLDEAYSALAKHHEDGNTLTGLDTGFYDLNDYLCGLQNGEMIIIAARPSMGKTAFMLNIAETISFNSKQPIAIFSLEMGKRQLAERLMSSRSGVDSQRMRRNMLNAEELVRLQAVVKEGQDIPIYIDDTPGLSLLDLRSKARRLAAQHDIKAVFVDYMQLMNCPGSENRQQEVTRISRGLKELARELNIPVVALSQLNRNPEGRADHRPNLSDLRESGCLSNQSTLLFTSTGVQHCKPSRMSTYTLNQSGHFENKGSSHSDSGCRRIVRIKTGGGRFIDCTPDHRLLTDIGWVEAEDLDTDCSIAAIRKIPTPKNARGIAEAKFIGRMLGNGSMLGCNSPSFICSDEEVAMDFLADVKKLFKTTPRAHPHPKCKSVWQYNITFGPWRTSRDNPCKDWLMRNSLWGNDSHGKEIPAWFMEHADDKSVASLLAGLIETDGCVTGNTLKIATVSQTMAWQIVWCFARLGIFAYIDKGYMGKKANYPCFNIGTSDGNHLSIAQDVLPICGIKGRKLRAIKCGPGSKNGDRIGRWMQDEINRERKARGLSYAQLGYRCQGKRISQSDLAAVMVKLPKLRKQFGHLINPSIYWDRYESRRPLGSVGTFDRCVSGKSHNFVANGLVVHNSIEQDADVVMMLHREEYYHKDDNWKLDNQEKVGLSEIIIAKQRNGPTGMICLQWDDATTRFDNRADKGAIEAVKYASERDLF